MILCVGMMVCDTLLRPVPSDILEIDSSAIQQPIMCCGGDALGTAVGLARLGESVSVVGRISNDINGNFIWSQCKKYGIDTADIIIDNTACTPCSYALIDEHNERHYLTERTMFDRLCGDDVPIELIRSSDIVYYGSVMAMRRMDSGGARDIFVRAHQFGKLTVMDAAITDKSKSNHWLDDLASVFEETDVFFPSIEEASFLTGETNPEKIMEYFRQFHLKYFGVKLGDKGCFITNFRRSKYITPPKGIPVVDTSGAGDSFMAGLLCGFSHGWDGFVSAEFAVCVATNKVGTVGGTSVTPGFEEAYKLLKNRSL